MKVLPRKRVLLPKKRGGYQVLDVCLWRWLNSTPHLFFRRKRMKKQNDNSFLIAFLIHYRTNICVFQNYDTLKLLKYPHCLDFWKGEMKLYFFNNSFNQKREAGNRLRWTHLSMPGWEPHLSFKKWAMKKQNDNSFLIAFLIFIITSIAPSFKNDIKNILMCPSWLALL